MVNAMSEIEEIIDTFELLEDWDQRYLYLVELGENLPAMPKELKTDANLVKPCMSIVHVSAEVVADKPELIQFLGDCDTTIIKGVLALLISLLSNRTLEEIQGIDVDGLFKRLQMEEHLSPSRHVGIYAIVDKMLESAAIAADSHYAY